MDRPPTAAPRSAPAWVGALVLAAAAGAWFLYGDYRDQRAAQRRQQRQAQTAADLNAAPAVREIVTPHGTLLEMRVPTDPFALGIVEHQLCYVWRDAQMRTASISCPNAPLPAAGD
jgi:hypothetical protein